MGILGPPPGDPGPGLGRQSKGWPELRPIVCFDYFSTKKYRGVQTKTQNPKQDRMLRRYHISIYHHAKFEIEQKLVQEEKRRRRNLHINSCGFFNCCTCA